jgi:hypothetical protein
LVVLLGASAASPAAARTTPAPVVDIQPVGGLAPDARSIGVQVLASCPERWSVVEAVVTVSQPQASGRASFPLTCIGSFRMFFLTVTADAGTTFELGTAQVTASVVIERGRTMTAQDSETVQVDPTVFVELAESARLVSGGGAVVLPITVACPAGTTGIRSSVNVSQAGQTSGNGTYTPICDGLPHTFDVTVTASGGTYHEGIAQALTFANIEYAGNTFYGIDDDGALELVS